MKKLFISVIALCMMSLAINICEAFSQTVYQKYFSSEAKIMPLVQEGLANQWEGGLFKLADATVLKLKSLKNNAVSGDAKDRTVAQIYVNSIIGRMFCDIDPYPNKDLVDFFDSTMEASGKIINPPNIEQSMKLVINTIMKAQKR